MKNTSFYSIGITALLVFSIPTLVMNTLQSTISPIVVSVPGNDNPCNAISLSVGRNTGSTAGATVTTLRENNTVCGSRPGKDVWFKTRVPASGAIKIRPEAPNSVNTQQVNLAVYTGSSCSTIKYAGICSKGEEIGIYGASGQEFYLRAWTSASTGSSFLLNLTNANLIDTIGGPVVFSPVVPITPLPENDEPCDATTLNVGLGCLGRGMTTIGATQTTSPSPLSICGSVPSGDVWFKVTMPSTRIVTVLLSPTTSLMPLATMAVYTGDCSSLNFTGICTNKVNLVLSGEPNTVVFIRAWGSTPTGGPFFICANNSGAPGEPVNPLPVEIKKPVNDEPCKAIQLTVRGECSTAQGTTVGATNTVNPASITICESTPSLDVWYKAIMPTTGIMNITTITTTSLMIGATVGIYTGSCSKLSFTGFCSNDQNFVINGSPGTMIFIRVWGESLTGGPFTICAKNKPTPGAKECHIN